MALLALVWRVVVVIFAFLLACFAAAAAMTVGILIAEWNSLAEMDFRGTWISVGFFGFTLSNFGLLPGFLVILLAESVRIRSVFFYAVAGGLGLLALFYSFGLGNYTPEPGRALGHALEIMAAAGIVGGFVYWAVAGRRAGAWQDRRAGASSREDAAPPAPPPAQT